MLQTHLGPGTTTANVIPITATFNIPVTGVAISDFNNDAAFPVEAGVSYALTGSGAEWVLTVTLDETPRANKPLSFNMAAGSGSISPANEPTSSPLTITYAPPKPTFSSSQGATGATVNADVILFTATFTGAVTGVTAADFGLVKSDASVLTTEAVSSNAANTEWVLAVTVTGGHGTSAMSVTMAQDSGAISPKTAAATNNGFSLSYAAPTVVLTSSETSPTTATSIPVTATFSSPVTGVTVADFNGGVAFPAEAGVTYTVTGSGTEWVLTVDVANTPNRLSKSFNFNMAADTGAVSPSNQAAAAALAMAYQPAVPTLSSSHGVTGANVAASQFTITATFDKPVTGVAASDFGITSSTPGVTYTQSVATTDNLAWVLTTDVTGGHAASAFQAVMTADSGSIVDKNAAASNNGFTLNCKHPLPDWRARLSASSLTRSCCRRCVVV